MLGHFYNANAVYNLILCFTIIYENLRNKRKITKNEKVQVGKDQEKAQSERDSHSKNRGGKKPN